MDDQFESDEYAQEAPELFGGSSLLERVRHRLGDVRIHDDTLAGDLTRRLGARAFTVGRDIYVRPDLLHPMNRQSEALLGHELFHVSEQTGIEMPLLMPGASSRSIASSDRSTSGHNTTRSVQRAPSGKPAPASTSASELAAEAIEAQLARDQGGETPEGISAAKPPDPEDVADRVYALIAQDLILERERAAYGWQ